MFVRLFMFFLGFILCVIGLTFCISYLNLFVLGYNFIDYVKFISSSFCCLSFIFGIIIILFSIFIPKGR